MEFVPGPDLPTGGLLLGLDEVRRAYETGRGVVRMRGPGRDRPARGQPGPAGDHGDRAALRRRRREGHRGDHRRGHQDQAADRHRRRQGPHRPGERHPAGHRVQGRASTRRRCSPTSTGSPRWSSRSASTTWCWSTGSRRRSGSRRCWRCSWRHRYEVVTRRTAYRRRKRQERLHLVDGLLIALLDIDKVVRLIRGSDERAGRQGRPDDASSGSPRSRPPTSWTPRCAG